MEEQEYKRRKALMSTTSIQSRSAENTQSQGKKFYMMYLSIKKVLLSGQNILYRGSLQTHFQGGK